MLAKRIIQKQGITKKETPPERGFVND